MVVKVYALQSKARLDMVKYTSSQRSKKKSLRTVFMVIFESEAEEAILVSMAQAFFDHSKEAKYMYFRQDDPSNNPLYQTLHRHNDKPNVLQTLLDNGCEIDTQFSWIFDPQLGAEGTSPLLWLLCQGDEATDSRTVEVLLDQGGSFLTLLITFPFVKR